MYILKKKNLIHYPEKLNLFNFISFFNIIMNIIIKIKRMRYSSDVDATEIPNLTRNEKVN